MWASYLETNTQWPQNAMPSVLALLFLSSRGGVLKYHFLNFDLCTIALLAVVYPNTD